MSKRIYSRISRADVDRLRGELGGFGITIPDGDDVEVAGPLGVRMQARYDESLGTLDLEITEKPAYVPEAQIWKVIELGAERAGVVSSQDQARIE